MKKRHAHKTNILLVNITRLGDMLQATPTIAGMKMENPDCKVTVLVEKQFEGVCHSIPNIDYIKSIDLGMTVRSLARQKEGIIDAYEYLTEVVEDLRGQQFDYCLNMSSSAYTALLLNLVNIYRRGGWTSDEEGYRVIESDWAQLFATSVFHRNRTYNSLNLVDVFRCSADVEEHPNKLLIDVKEEDREYCRGFINEAGFSNTGPLVTIQAGASQGKRQWAPERFVRLINILVNEANARVVLSGTKKELEIIEPIFNGCNSENVVVAAGKTNIQQLAALLEMSELLVTGDTGPMHISVAVGTPVVSMFLASAYGFETGPYSEGNLVLQPVLECGPCNPNKSCARPDCHDLIEPEVVAKLVQLRLKEDLKSLPEGLVDPHKVIVYRSFFDKWGFCDLAPLNSDRFDTSRRYRDAYRRLWMDDIGDLKAEEWNKQSSTGALSILGDGLEGIDQVLSSAKQGSTLILELQQIIKDPRGTPQRLGDLSVALEELDRKIEQLGYHYPHLGPLTRMFIFGKENLSGTEAFDLASQMGNIYSNLERRSEKFVEYYNAL